MGKRNSKKHKKVYKMKGCAQKKSRKNKKSIHRYLGGSSSSSTPLAYTGHKIQMSQNPNLTPKLVGGSRGGNNFSVKTPLSPANYTNSANPSVMGAPTGNINTNMGTYQKGGSCGTCNLMKGGSCGKQMPMSGGAHTLEPAGLVGNPWTPNSSGWPGVDGISGNRNYLDYNLYKSDPQTALISVGANKPFLFGGKKTNTRRRKKIKQRGGVISNLLGQDFLNLGRQVKFDVGSGYNGINGYAAPVNPLPWKDQFPRMANLSSMKSMAL
jgi:hypothetical protein